MFPSGIFKNTLKESIFDICLPKCPARIRYPLDLYSLSQQLNAQTNHWFCFSGKNWTKDFPPIFVYLPKKQKIMNLVVSRTAFDKYDWTFAFFSSSNFLFLGTKTSKALCEYTRLRFVCFPKLKMISTVFDQKIEKVLTPLNIK